MERERLLLDFFSWLENVAGYTVCRDDTDRGVYDPTTVEGKRIVSEYLRDRSENERETARRLSSGHL